MDFLEKEKKLMSSEATEHERISPISRNKKIEGYEEHPREEKSCEVFGLKNSFDNLSVGTDDHGRLILAVSSQKGYHSETLTSDKKKLKGSRKRIAYEHFGELYTNSFSRGDGAFAMRTNKDLPESRILREMRSVTSRRLTEKQRETMPVLSLDQDRKELQHLRSETDTDPLLDRRKQAAENVVVKKTELENRFLRRLRIARQQTYQKHDDVQHIRHRIVSLIEQDNNDDNDDNDNSNTGDSKEL